MGEREAGIDTYSLVMALLGGWSDVAELLARVDVYEGSYDEFRSGYVCGELHRRFRVELNGSDTKERFEA